MPFARMVHPMNRLQIRDIDLRVDLRCLQACVPEQLLDMADVGAAFEHVRCAGMPQAVRMNIFRDSRSPGRAPYGIDHGEAIKRLPVFH